MSLTLRHAPRISREKFAAILKAGTQAGTSPVAPIADECYGVITAAGLDPAIILAIWAKESQYGVTGISPQTHNIGNVRTAYHPDWAIGQHPKGFAIYPDWFTGIRDLVDRLDKRYIDEWGLTTVDQIITKYAPPSENDTAGYITFVNNHVVKWVKEDTGPMTLPIDTTTYRSPNFNGRGGVPISGILLHTTEGSWPSDAEWLSSDASQVSAHYVISPQAKVYQLVDDVHRAWHAGVGTYLGLSDWNTFSIGVDVSHREGHPWAVGQRDVLRDLCLSLIAKHPIRQERIAAHRWIAPDRRRDPTDWSDSQLKTWIAGLYGSPPPHPVLVFFKATVAARVRQGPGTTFPTVRTMLAGEVAGFDGETIGEMLVGNNVWRHHGDGQGFTWSGLLVPA